MTFENEFCEWAGDESVPTHLELLECICMTECIRGIAGEIKANLEVRWRVWRVRLTDRIATDTSGYGKKKPVETDYGKGEFSNKDRVYSCCKSKNNVYFLVQKLIWL